MATGDVTVAPGRRSGKGGDRQTTVDGDEQLVGRGHELAAIDALLSALAAGGGSALLITGSAGLGKSGLLAATALRAAGAGLPVLSARALPAELHVPYGLAVRLLEPALAPPASAARAAQFAGAARIVRPLFDGGAADTAVTTDVLLRGLVQLTARLTAGRPVVVCVDDVHLADEGSVCFLGYLARRFDRMALGLVVAGRPLGAGEDAALTELRGELEGRRIELGPLDREAVALLVRRRLAEADDAVVAACAEVTGGSPYYLHELVRAVAAEAVTHPAELAARLRAVGFTTIGRAALVRLGRLGADAIALARALAVLGDGTALRHAAALAGLDASRAARAADLLVGEQLLVRGTALGFAHPLLAQAIAAELPPQHRATAHLRAARLLAGGGAPAAVVAAHLLQAPEAADPWVVAALRASADEAMLRGLPAVAARELARALREPPGRRERPGVLLELGAAELAAAQPAALDHLTEAVELATVSDRPRAQRLLARAHGVRGDRIRAAAVLENALDLAASEQLRDHLLSDYLVHALDEPRVRQRALRRAAQLYRSVPAGQSPGERVVLAVLALRSALDAAPATRSRALAVRAWRDGALLAEQGVDSPGWVMVTWALQLADDLPGAHAVVSAAVAAAQRSGTRDALAAVSCLRARICLNRGLLADAQADTETALEVGRGGPFRLAVESQALHAVVRIERGDWQGAAAELDALPATSGVERAWVLFARGWLQLAGNRAADALLLFLRVGSWLRDELAADHSALPWRAAAAHAALAIGDRARARELSIPLLELGESAGLPIVHARGLHLLGMLDGGPTGAARLRSAGRLYASAGAALAHAATLVDLGGLLRRDGGRKQARDPLQRALDEATRLGAVRLAERARTELAAAGARPRTAVRSGPGALTASEARVCRLAADGLSNPEIAQALFVSPKTVEYHLHNAYRKLGVRGRAELATALGTAGPPR
jgi:DNA-binding CsgD family transcriptional regulator